MTGTGKNGAGAVPRIVVPRTVVIAVVIAALVTGLIGGGLALWWRYGLAVALAEPSWFCLPR